MSYSRQVDIPYSGLSGYTEQVWLLVVLSYYVQNPFRRYHSHVCCVGSENWPHDIAFSQDGGNTFKNYIRLELTSHLLLCLVPIDGFDDGTMTVYWGDASAPDYADNSDVLLEATVDLAQSPVFLPYVLQDVSFSTNVSPPFLAFSAIASDSYIDTVWKFTADDGFYIHFFADQSNYGVSINGSGTNVCCVNPQSPPYNEPWFLTMKALEDRVRIEIKTNYGLYSSEKTGDVSGKTFTTLTVNLADEYDRHLNTFVVSYRNVHWPDRSFSFGEIPRISCSFYLEETDVLPQTRRYWVFSGYVTEGGSPAKNDIIIWDRKTGLAERVQSRPSDGYWEYRITRFHQQLRGGNWMSRDMTLEEMDKRFAVFCHDPDQVYNAKIYDHLTPVLVEIED